MTLLLDTHTFLWWLRDDHRLGRRARQSIARAQSAVLVSAASVWEIAIKAGLEKLKWPSRGPALADAIDACGFVELAITGKHAALVAELPLHHADPFDRLLIAQATIEGVPLVTCDDLFRRYAVQTIAADA